MSGALPKNKSSISRRHEAISNNKKGILDSFYGLNSLIVDNAPKLPKILYSLLEHERNFDRTDDAEQDQLRATVICLRLNGSELQGYLNDVEEALIRWFPNVWIAITNLREEWKRNGINETSMSLKMYESRDRCRRPAAKKMHDYQFKHQRV